MIRTGHFGKDQGHRIQVLMNVIALAGCNSRRAAKIQFSQRQKRIGRDAGMLVSFLPDLQNFIKTTTSRLSGQSGRVSKLTKLQEKENKNNQVLTI